MELPLYEESVFKIVECRMSQPEKALSDLEEYYASFDQRTQSSDVWCATEMKRLLSIALKKHRIAVFADRADCSAQAIDLSNLYQEANAALMSAYPSTSEMKERRIFQRIIDTFNMRRDELSNKLQAAKASTEPWPRTCRTAQRDVGVYRDLEEFYHDFKSTKHQEKGYFPRWRAHGKTYPPKKIDGFRKRLLLVIGLLALVLIVRLCENLDFSRRLIDAPGRSKTSHRPCMPLKDIPQRLQSFQDCSITQLREDTNLDFLRTAKPLDVSEYESRRNRLAHALVADGLDAFMVEPGYTLQYYASVDQPRWEVWEPEERPFVMLVRPWKTSNGEILANTSFLVPSFEKERARLLDMPFEEEPGWITYEEHWNPYTTLIKSTAFAPFSERQPKIMVDEEMRDFISRGLATNGFEVVGLGGEVERVRQIKSEAEIGILRAVNTGTVEAVRAMRKCMKRGLSEDDVMQVLDNTMRSVGLHPFFDIVLFDENASNPHGGTDGGKVLEYDTMVLIDVGAHLYGYSSDICRSFFGPWFLKPENNNAYQTLGGNIVEKLIVWDIVLDAQTASLNALHENSTAAAIDIAAREVITEAGYGRAFTHRVGHGIGIKAHESPYLNKGNVNTTLKAGMTFTSEPGIYLVDKFGVRHEDVLLVREDGLPELLTGQRARSPWEP